MNNKLQKIIWKNIEEFIEHNDFSEDAISWIFTALYMHVDPDTMTSYNPAFIIKKENIEDHLSRSVHVTGYDGANGNKQRLTVQISEDITERAKNAVYWTRGLTLAQLTEEALEKAIRALEKNSVIFDDETGKPLKEKGAPFPNRKEELKSGRPVK